MARSPLGRKEGDAHGVDTGTEWDSLMIAERAESIESEREGGLRIHESVIAI